MVSNVNQQTNDFHFKKWFFFVILYLLIDYCRPQDTFSLLSHARLGAITTLVLIYFLFSKKKIKLAYSIQTKLIFYFLGLLCSYIPFAVNNYLAYITAKTILLYLPFILSVIIIVNSTDILKKFININLLFMNYILIYGIFNEGRGAGNYFTDENDISLYACTWIPFAFYLFISSRGKIRLFYLISLFIAIASVVVSFSRGGFVGLISVFIVIWLFSPKKLLSFVIILVIAGGLWLYTDSAYKKEMSTVTDITEGTATERLLSWQAAWNMFIDNPLGVGGNNFQILFPKYQPPELKKNMWGRVAHSLWFTLIPELGILGIIIFISLLYYNLKDIFIIKKMTENSKNPDLIFLHHISLAFFASFAGFFSSATFLSVLYYAHFWYMTAYIVATKNITMKIISNSTDTSLIAK